MKLFPDSILPHSFASLSEEVPPNASVFQRLFEARSNGCLGISLSNDDTSALGAISHEVKAWIGPPGTGEDAPFPFVRNGDMLYTGRDYYYESRIVEGLKRLQASDCQFPEINATLRNGFSKRGFSIGQSKEQDTDWQWVASLHALGSPLTVLTGGPGTGKTTTLARMLGLMTLLKPNIRIRLAAPTGKAAVRMQESLLHAAHSEDKAAIQKMLEKHPPTTIHRLLESKYQTPFFKRNRENPLQADVVVIDECSMIGASLFAHLLDALQAGSRLILLGDPDQLASVESGSVFADICKAMEPAQNKFHSDFVAFYQNVQQSDAPSLETQPPSMNGNLIRLMRTYRFDSKSPMGTLSSAVIHGNSEIVDTVKTDLLDNFYWDEDYSEDAWKEFGRLYIPYILEKDIYKALEKFNEVRVLCAFYKSDHGVDAMNQWMEDFLRRSARANSDMDFYPVSGDFYHNQPILITQNMHSLGLSNGDVGIIRKDEGSGQLMAYFSDNATPKNSADTTRPKVRKVSPGLITHCTTVFAMTIHKSQGSEFKNLLLILPQEDHPLLTRELVYTGLTRAKSGGRTVLQVKGPVLKAAIGKCVQRVSNIVQRLTQ